MSGGRADRRDSRQKDPEPRHLMALALPPRDLVRGVPDLPRERLRPPVAEGDSAPGDDHSGLESPPRVAEDGSGATAVNGGEGP